LENIMTTSTRTAAIVRTVTLGLILATVVTTSGCSGMFTRVHHRPARKVVTTTTHVVTHHRPARVRRARRAKTVRHFKLTRAAKRQAVRRAFKQLKRSSKRMKCRTVRRGRHTKTVCR